jgi:hypothetical protein
MVATTGHAHHTLDHSIQEIVEESYLVWGDRVGAAPTIKILSPGEFNRAVCDKECPKFIVAAYRAGTIYLRDNWDPADVWQASYLVHEMIHHLQDQAGMHPAAPNCEDAWRLELQAYELQNRWLLQYQKMIPRMMLMHMIAASTGCSPH